MADAEVEGRVAELEQKLGNARKRELGAVAREDAEARKRLFAVPERTDLAEIAQTIAALADSKNVVVKWTARDLDLDSSLAASRIVWLSGTDRLSL